MNALKRALISTAILLILTCGVRPAQAAPIPFIVNLDALGLELCPQSFCGAAIFVGILNGQVGANPNALGTFVVGIKHGDLPEGPPPDFAPVKGGTFEFRFGLQRIRGVVNDGVIFNNQNNTFLVLAELQTIDNDLMDAVVLLDHRVFPPTVRALVFSQ